MAFVAPGAGSRFALTAMFTDVDGLPAQRVYELPFNTDIPTTIDNAIALLADLQALSGLRLAEANLGVPLVDAVAPAADANGFRFKKGLIDVNLVVVPGGSQDETGQLNVPSPTDAALVAPTGPSSYIIDVGDALVTAFVDNFKATGVATLSDGQNVVPGPSPASISGGRIVTSRTDPQG